METLQKELAALLNRHSAENGSDTPDFVLSELLTMVMACFDHATKMRAAWYGRIPPYEGVGDPEDPRWQNDPHAGDGELLRSSHARRNTRSGRQHQALNWVRRAFGDANATRQERINRFLEEALELVQAEGVSKEFVEKLTAHVYGKPPGDPKAELGGVGLTLLAYAESGGLDADAAERAELARVEAMDVAEFRTRHQAKADAGVALPVDTDK